MKHLISAAVVLCLAGPAYAQSADTGAVSTKGDAAAGEAQFNRQCVACHVVQNAAGEVLAGRNAKVGPNLYGVAMRPAGSYPGYNYDKAMLQANEKGLIWTEENFVPYVQGPTEFFRAYLDDSRARGKMVYKVRTEAEAYDLYAFLSSIGPKPDAGTETATPPSN